MVCDISPVAMFYFCSKLSGRFVNFYHRCMFCQPILLDQFAKLLKQLQTKELKRMLNYEMIYFVNDQKCWKGAQIDQTDLQTN